MRKARRKRLLSVVLMMGGVALAVAVALYALSQNINLFYTPTQVLNGQIPKGRLFRLGGMVTKGSIQKDSNDLKVRFVLHDKHQSVTVVYRGILPDLFREGQGIVADGRLNAKREFVANQVLAKHDATYMPRNLRKSLDEQHHKDIS
jgi:cytochrome c-type biogenesis protein CcmE